MTANETLSRQFRDLLEIQENMVEALQDLQELSPTINVEQPAITISPPPPAKVEVHPPQVTIAHAKGWTFTITERERDGRIKTMKATPIT